MKEGKEEKEELLKGRQEVEKITGITVREQKRIEKGVEEVIGESKRTADAMKKLGELGTDIRSVYAGAVLQAKTGDRNTKICLAVPVDLLEMLYMSEMLEMLETLGMPGLDAD
jgi:diphthamide synthase (EF-2-diphthine--ammonia ligase)